jgi:FtsP/CotA-like multicopper oxidase with cupredoxin domain
MNKISRRNFLKLGLTAGAALAVPWSVFAQTPPPPPGKIVPPHLLQRKVKPADRQAAANRLTSMGVKPGVAARAKAMDPGGFPHYFGPYANYANSPLPAGGIGSLLIDSGGSGYTAPVVTIDDVYGTGGGAQVTATLGDIGQIIGFTIVNPGAGYTAPFVTIADPTGSGALASAAIGGVLVGGIRKYVDSLPGLGPTNANNLGVYLPVGIPETVSYNSIESDYYEIALVQFKQKFHSDLPETTLRGYVQLDTPGITADPANLHVPLFNIDGSAILKPDGTQAIGVDQPRYLGTTIVCQRDRPVRIRFFNLLPTGAGGDLFIPVDETVMGAGEGPFDLPGQPGVREKFTQNRATLHLHGGLTPWISDGTPHQWTTPANEATQYPKGASVFSVPDMDPPGDGSLTFYYTNQQSARLMFYHDHAYGITRLNVYVGEVAGYVITDQVDQDLFNGTNVTGVNLPNPNNLLDPSDPNYEPNPFMKVLPDVGIPLIVQDKTFVDANTIPGQDPTWNWGTTPGTPVTGDLWVPSVYMPAQNPWDPTGASAFGRWQYGPWFWPPTYPTVNPYLVPNPYYDPINAPWEPPQAPIMPRPSMGMEAFNDTPTVNGIAYPYLEVDPKVYRFRILNGANDRFFNLHFYVADPDVVTADNRINTEVKMVPALATPGYPATWSTDGRAGGVPDPFTAGPSWIQIGNEGGFLPAPTVIPPQPINWNMNQTAFNFGNVTDHSLLLGPAERADVLVDFSQFAGQTLIMYNDAPAAFPAIDPRYDYYTSDPDQTDAGGAPTTLPGFGPNTRAIMQVRVGSGTMTGQPLNGVTVTAGGQDYVNAPDVVFTGGSPTTPAIGMASGAIDHATIVSGGFGYSSIPTVTFSAPQRADGVTATGYAVLTGGRVTGIVVTNKGSGYTNAPSVSFTNATAVVGAIATSALTITEVILINPGAGYLSRPMVTLVGGSGYGAEAVATLYAGPGYDLATLQAVFAKTAGKQGVFEVSQDPIIITQSAYNSAYDMSFPTDIASQYVGLQDFSRSIFGGLLLPDGRLTNLAIFAAGTGYVNPVAIAIAGGGGTAATGSATADPVTGAITSVTLDQPGTGYISAPTITVAGSGGSGSGAIIVANEIKYQPKAIHDEMNAAYEPVYGRMSGMLGLELPVTNALNQNLVLYGYASPPVDVLRDSVAPLGSLDDGTQIWKITHNGVDTHPIHFHLFNVQLINRVAWDAAMLPPDPNELGWKETVRINPLEHCIVAVRPVAPSLPFDIPNSYRPIDVTQPLGVPLMGGPLGWLDPLGNAAPIVNHMVNFGWEYVWHCHILSHEEMDMMHAMSFATKPKAPSNLTGTLLNGPRRIRLTWTNNALNSTGFQIERANDIGFTTGLVTYDIVGTVTTYTDANGIANNTPYYYRVRAVNTVGDTTVYAAPAIGYPTQTVMSDPSNIAEMAPPQAPSDLVATQPGAAGTPVILTWTDNATNETNFTVQRSNNGVNGWTTLTTTVAASPGVGLTVTYSNTNVQRGRTYYYRVMARNAFGTGAASNTASIMTK